MPKVGQPTHQVPGKPSSFPCFEQEMVSSPGRIIKSTHLPFLQKVWTVMLHRAPCRSWRIIQSLLPPPPEPPNPIKLSFYFTCSFSESWKRKKPFSCTQRQPLSSWIWVHRQCLPSPSGLGTSSFWTAHAATLNNVMFHYKINLSSLPYRFAAKAALCGAQWKVKRCSCPGVYPLLVSVHRE